jgi:hypothetical protein
MICDIPTSGTGCQEHADTYKQKSNQNVLPYLVLITYQLFYAGPDIVSHNNTIY